MTRRTRLHVAALDDRCLPSFSPITSWPAGPEPRAVATADFNNDGKLDLATTGYSRVGVRLGDGAGGFGPAQEFNTGWWNLYSIAVADFNNDSRPDFVVGHLNGFTILTGNGDGTFQSAVTEPVGSWGFGYFAVGDFNNDRNIDLVVTSYNADFMLEYATFLGNGQGGFTYLWGSSMQGTGELAAVDLDNDGKLDVATADGLVLLGYGNGYFHVSYGQQPPVPSAWAVAAGDITGDGNADLVSASNSVAVLRGRGDGGFLAPIFHSANGTAHTAVATADFNADKKLDAVVANGDTGTVSMMLGNGDGTLRYAGAFATGATPGAVAVGDFNRDGRPDVAVANGGSNTVSVLLNDGNWGMVPPLPPSIRIHDATVSEGNAGAVAAAFTVTLSAASTETITVAYATAAGNAADGTDYTSTSGTLTFSPGETHKTISVPVNGDRIPEANETFYVNLSAATNAAIGDGQGVGTILDDEPRISISDVTKSEGRKNQTTLFAFTVTLSAAYDQPVTMSFRTVNGTATTGDNDYVARTGTLTFAPGETMKTITIEVKGDNKREANETFYLDLFGNSGNSLFTKSRGIGTILNDD